MKPKVNLYIQGSKHVGMGHLSRSASLCRQLTNLDIKVNTVLVVDSRGKEFAAKIGLVDMEPDNACTAEIFDGIHISAFRKYISAKTIKSILVSPVFDDCSQFDYVLVRHKSKLQHLNHTTEVIQNFDYGFVTSRPGSLVNVSTENFTVGICLGGSDSYSVDLESLATGLLNIPKISTIKVCCSAGQMVTYKKNMTPIDVACKSDVWDYFDDLSLNLTGDGNLLYESVSKSIPTITVDRGASKNTAMFNRGLAWSVDANSFNITRFIEGITIKQSILDDMRRKLMLFNKIDRSQALAKSIFDITTK